jgi:ribose/xylose/arabinose/galactoside ABC-type transport system permease subunit
MTSAKTRWRRVPWAQLALLVAVLVPIATTRNFLTARTLGDILALASIVGVLAVGQAFVLMGGGFDLSQGAAVTLSAAATAWALDRFGLSPGPAAAIALGVGAVLGAINGLAVAGAGTSPFVATLSTQLVYRGAAYVLLEGRPIPGITAFTPLSDPTRGVSMFGTAFPPRALMSLGVAAVAWVVMRYTVFGRHVYAVGGNAEAARLAGVRTRRIRIVTFSLSGLSAGLAAVLLLSWVRVAKPDTGFGYELDSIAACVVGGISLQGGSGSVLGAAGGVLLLQALATWITLSGFPDEYRTLVTGAVILTFAAVDALARRGQR